MPIFVFVFFICLAQLCAAEKSATVPQHEIEPATRILDRRESSVMTAKTLVSEKNMIQAATTCLLINQTLTPILRRGLERLQTRGGAPVDVVFGRNADDAQVASYAWVISLHTDTKTDKGSDAWAVEVAPGKPGRITLRSASERGLLYGLYHVAECLATGKEPAAWAIQRQPAVARRYAWIEAGNCWSPVFRPDQFEKALKELPGMGFNGVLLICNQTCGTHFGRETIPFSLTPNGVVVDRQKLPAFQALCEDLKSYGLDIHLFHQAFTPPPFTAKQVRAYYDGRGALPGFEAAVEKRNRELAEAIFTHLPQVDGLLHHSLECDWMWGDAVSIFPCHNDTAAGGAFAAYLRGLDQACQSKGKTLSYWTHVCGVSARQIRLQQKILSQFPEVIVIEDHVWPNGIWPHAPIMGHIAEDVIAQVRKGRFGISIDTTDGEYYGAGSLPTAYPDPHIRAAATAVKLGAEMSFVRINEQSLTPLGTMDDINAIHVITTAEEWWQSPRPTDELWQAWVTRRFSKAAAPALVSALKKSAIFINQGLSAGRMPLIDHSGLAVNYWQPGDTTNAWAVFARPGKLLVDKTYDQLNGAEFRPWQVQAKGVELDEFLKNSAQAEAAMRVALSEIASVREHLTPADALYLTTCFEDSLLMIEAVRRTAVAARANALCRQGGGEEQKAVLKQACAAMEDYAKHIESVRGNNFRALHWFIKTNLNGKEHAGYGVPIGLRVLAGQYRQDAKVQP